MPRILFLPVSGRYGMGEYARCASIARAAAERWSPDAVHFMLSREAPYAAGAPFPVTLLDASPTLHTAEVAEFVRRWRPDVVVFDNAGRTAQLAAARAAGARVVFVSARRRQRARAFRLRWMRLIDEHWMAYPQFLAGPLGWLERRKLGWLGRPVIRHLDVIMSRPGAAQAAAVLARLGLTPGRFVLVVPGGGTGHPGAADAVGRFLEAAATLAGRGVATVFVGGAGGGAPGADERAAAAGLRCIAGLPQAELVALLGAARLVVANGGATLLQAIACGRACVAVPIAKDQRERIRGCVRAGVAVAAAPTAAGIVDAAAALLGDEPRRAGLEARAAALELADGVAVALGALEGLLGGSA